MSLTGEGRRGQLSPPGPQSRAERKRKPPCPFPAPGGEGAPWPWASPSLPGQGPLLGRGISMRGEGSGRGGPVSLEVPVLQVAVLKGEAFLLPLAPLLVVKVDVGALLKLICDGLGLLMPLEPHHVLGVESPGLLL